HVLHANIRFDGVELAGGDVAPARYRRPQGFCVLLGLESEERVRASFEALREGGEVVLAPRPTFWSPCYAIVVDRFGVPWKLNCGSGAAAGATPRARRQALGSRPLRHLSHPHVALASAPREEHRPDHPCRP